ncbi:MAG: hypothetical protein K6E30_01605 [Lachnospiraceae bacterium]|nr:hypothetical protein [Lachnospiraceae bacterium]
MKFTVEKIAAAILGLGLSILAAILGMYMVFTSELKFIYHLLYSAAFILQPVQTVILIRYMFMRPEDRRKQEDDELDDEDELSEEFDEFDAEEDAKPAKKENPFGLFGRKKDEETIYFGNPDDDYTQPEAPNSSGSRDSGRSQAASRVRQSGYENPSFKKASYTPLPPVTPPAQTGGEEDPLAPYLVKPDIPASEFDTLDTPDTSASDLARIEKNLGEIADIDSDAEGESSLAGSIGKRFGGMFGKGSRN